MVVQFIDRIERFLAVCAAAALLSMMLLISADTLMRYLLDAPITGVFEIVENYMMPLIVFFTLSYAFSSDKTIRIDVLIRKLEDQSRRYFEIVSAAVGLIFICFLLYGALKKTIWTIDMGALTEGGVEIPLWPGYVAAAVGLSVHVLRLLHSFVAATRNQ